MMSDNYHDGYLLSVLQFFIYDLKDWPGSIPTLQISLGLKNVFNLCHHVTLHIQTLGKFINFFFLKKKH